MVPSSPPSIEEPFDEFSEGEPMPAQLAFSLNREKPLDVDLEAANKRVHQIAKALEPSVLELSTLLAEGRAMVFGLNFQSGAELSAFLVSAALSEIAFLMEKGLLPKRLPKGAQAAAENGSDKGYL